MKFFKALVIAVLLGLASLVIIGVFVPEIDDEFELQVNKPIITVFAAMMNTGEYTQWINGLESIERTGGVLAMPGSTFQLKFKSHETEQTYKMEILEVVPMKSAKVRIYNDVVDVNLSIKMKADAIATDMDVFVQIKGEGLVSRAMLPLMKTAIMDQIAQDFDAFKQLQENN